MEFHEKLLSLRKQKGLTQEELAQALYVSRTAISKWESGRGYPSIDSLKQLAQFFAVSIDDLLSSREVLSVAEEDRRQQRGRFLDLIYGLSDLSALLFLFLPLFGQAANGTVLAVSLLRLTGVAPYLRGAYFAFVAAMASLGILTLSLQNCTNSFWAQNKHRFSLLVGAIGALLLIISSQPYAAALLFLLLIVKVLFLLKKQ